MRLGVINGMVATLLLTAVACIRFSPEGRIEAQADVWSAPYTLSTDGGALKTERWWLVFQDAQLERLINTALTNNLSLVQAEARLRQARALARQAGAAARPEITASATVGSSLQRAQAPGRSSYATSTWETYGLGLAGSYELDVWGRVAAQRNVAEADVRANQYDLATVAMTVAAEIAQYYFNWLAQAQTVKLLEQQVATNKQVLDLMVARYAGAQATALDVLQQQNILAQTTALLPNARAEEQILQQQLNVLMGLAPQTALVLQSPEFPGLPLMPATGLPSALLTNRPDVQAALTRLEGAGWQISAAKAERLPALRLTASAVTSSDKVASLFDDWLANVAGNLAAPLLDGGRRVAEVERVRAMEDEKVGAFRAVFLDAVFEVESAMVREQRQRETIIEMEKQLQLLQRTRAESTRRYSRGMESYLAVLTAELGVQAQARSLIQARNSLLKARVQLYRALGGDWLSLVKSLENVEGKKELDGDGNKE